MSDSSYDKKRPLLTDHPDQAMRSVTVSHRTTLASGPANPATRVSGRKAPGTSCPALNEERLKTIVLEEAYRTIRVWEGEKNISILMVKVVFRALAVSAAKGNNRAAQLFTYLLQTTERKNKALHDEWLNIAHRVQGALGA